MRIKAKLALCMATLACALCVAPGMAFADTGTVKVYYNDSTTPNPQVVDTANPLVDAIALANGNPNINRLVLSNDTFTPTAHDQLQISRDGLVVEGEGPNTLIDCGGFSCSGQAGLLIGADGVSLSNVTVSSAGGGNVSAIKVSKIGTAEYLPPVVGCTITDVTVSSLGHGLNIHGAENVSVTNLIVTSAGKAGVAMASAEDVVIEKVKIVTVGDEWSSISIMFDTDNPDNPAYQTPTSLTLKGKIDLEKPEIKTERPASADGGRDSVAIESGGVIWTMEPADPNDPSKGWLLEPAAPEQTFEAVDTTTGMQYATLQGAVNMAPSGAQIKLLSPAVGPISINQPDNSLTIIGNGNSISGGIILSAAMDNLTLDSLVLTGSGLSADSGIGNLSVTGSTFSNIFGTAISVNNLTGAANISGNTIGYDATNSANRAVVIYAAAGENPTISITNNSFTANGFDGATSGPLVQISGSSLSGALNLSSNYWNGLDPASATAANGVSIADISGAPSAIKTVYPYYGDPARSQLLYGPPTPTPVPTGTPTSLAATGDPLDALPLAVTILCSTMVLFGSLWVRKSKVNG